MVEAVGTVSVNTAVSVRGATHNAAARSLAENIAAADQKGSSYVSSRIRVDNLLNLAILEWRSDTGDVVNQIPTEGQIRAFKRAEAADKQREQSEPVAQVAAEPAPEAHLAEASVSVDVPATPAPAPQVAAPAPAPEASTPDAPAASSGDVHQSIIV